MPQPRKSLVSPETTPYYHCISRCVRRAFLCGRDTHSGRDFEHRRGWIETRLLDLADIFGIEIAAYAIMHNHYHVVLHILSDTVAGWSDDEVITRWHRLFKGSLFSQRYLQGDALSKAEQEALQQQVKTWREHLCSISWFMRCVNEPIAREANKEDQVSGRFWEGRFKSYALLDEKALLACMAYVDLNPIRAELAKTPESSVYTSIQRRIQGLKQKTSSKASAQKSLQTFAGYPRNNMPPGLPFRLDDYLKLVDWTGRIIREDKRGAIPEQLPDILQRLDLDARHWLYLSRHFESPFKHLVGAAHNVRRACEHTGKQWAQGIRQCERLFSSG